VSYFHGILTALIGKATTVGTLSDSHLHINLQYISQIWRMTCFPLENDLKQTQEAGSYVRTPCCHLSEGIQASNLRKEYKTTVV